MGRSDEELVEACQAGEASAFDVLVARWEDRIRGAAYRILGSEEEARDVAQEAFLKAYRVLGGLSGRPASRPGSTRSPRTSAGTACGGAGREER
jgi:DNA-directed RNA polymerase specialized sigma24 family protein